MSAPATTTTLDSLRRRPGHLSHEPPTGFDRDLSVIQVQAETDSMLATLGWDLVEGNDLSIRDGTREVAAFDRTSPTAWQSLHHWLERQRLTRVKEARMLDLADELDRHVHLSARLDETGTRHIHTFTVNDPSDRVEIKGHACDRPTLFENMLTFMGHYLASGGRSWLPR